MEARSRKYHTMRNGFLMACLLAAITAGGEVRLDKVWEFSENNSMKPAWMGANTERSMANPSCRQQEAHGIAAKWCKNTCKTICRLNGQSRKTTTSEEDTRNELMRRILAYDYDAGIKNIDASGVSVYPNPATSLLHVSIDCANSGNVCMEIFDTNGRSVFNRQESCEQGRHAWTVDVSCFQRGIYVCRVTTDEGTNIVKIIVK